MTHVLDRIAGALAGRYTVRRVIGRGGMGTVYLARDTKHERQVAVKVLDPEFAAVIGTSRFLREIEIAANLHHPHILPLYDSGEVDGTIYYVMPFVEGESLRDRLDRERQLPIDDALRITRDVADALHYAHTHGVVHRDIKPGNILLQSKHAVVADFGIALLADSVARDRITSAGLVIGTPSYMSPEQGMESHAVDGRSDIYSLGCVLYEMLSGQVPFAGATPQVIHARKLAESVPSLRVARDTVPEWLEQVTLKALSRNAADRFSTAEELVQALNEGGFAYQRISSPVGGAGWTPPQAASMPAEGPPGSSAARATRVAATWVGGIVGVLLLATLIGFVTQTVYDVRMRTPAEYTPSSTDFTFAGLRALIPVFYYAIPVFAGYFMAKNVARGIGFLLGRIPSMARRTASLTYRVRTAASRSVENARPAALAELLFLASIAFTAVLLVLFRNYVTALFGENVDGLGCSARPTHHLYTFAFVGLGISLASAWRPLGAHLRRRQISSVAYWGGLAWLLVILVIVTAPWRVVWNNYRARALFNGEPAYVLSKPGSNAVLYLPRRHETQRFDVASPPGLVRLQTDGYVFDFDGSGC